MSSSSSSSSLLRFVRLTEHARSPTRGSHKADGFDLYSASNTTVPAMVKELIFTDLQIQLPNGCYGRIATHSGLALAYRIDFCAGVIGEDYRGNICVIIYNYLDTPFIVTCGDRIAQIICEKTSYPTLEVKTLHNTERGAEGFGSTGTT